MSETTPSPAAGGVYLAVVDTSRLAAYALLVAMAVIMVAEVFCRYAFGAPLGWNVSLIEKVLLPGIVFLGLPWARASAAHVSAGMVYDRMPVAAQRTCSVLAEVLELVCYLALFIGGAAIAVKMYQVGAVPPPLSSQVPLPSWVWRLFLPLGAAASALLLIADVLARRGRREHS